VTTQTAITPKATLVLAYGPRPTPQSCYMAGCGTTVPADTASTFGYETEDGEHPICGNCLRLHMPAEASALDVLHVIAEAFHNGGGPGSDTASSFLWTIGEGIELLDDDPHGDAQ
jgi:hypothetical protein